MPWWVKVPLAMSPSHVTASSSSAAPFLVFVPANVPGKARDAAPSSWALDEVPGFGLALPWPAWSSGD